ncbi:MAG: single-stranded-DNA-specific exonuclease RecJ, partial [Pseudomonadota bacterium]
MSVFLKVEASVSKRRWVGPGPQASRQADAIAHAATLPLPVAAVLARLGVAPEEAEAFLAPRLRDLLPDPRKLIDMSRAAARLNMAANAGERIAIFADYDVDGAASAALLVWWLRALGRSATLYVPDRIDEGYGPNPEAIALLSSKHDLIVCVDCGTVSHDALAAAEGSAEVLVLDHHLGGETVPPVHAVVNPNRQDESRELGHLCAAAVVFLCLVEANRLRKSQGGPVPELMALLDLVGLATIADVAPLIGANRAFIRQGLKVMGQRARPGLVALADLANPGAPVTAKDLGYGLGPRINAGGRIGQADLGARLLSTSDPSEAAALAERLDKLNTERREIEASVRSVALEQAAARPGFDALSWAAGEAWHPGIVGIVAARLKEATQRPAVIIGFDGEIGRGSARSVPGVDLGMAVQRLASEGLIERGGGHKMAAGLTLTKAQLHPAMARLDSLLAAQMAAQAGATDLRLDGLIAPEAVSVELIERLAQAGPFGAAWQVTDLLARQGTGRDRLVAQDGKGRGDHDLIQRGIDRKQLEGHLGDSARDHRDRLAVGHYITGQMHRKVQATAGEIAELEATVLIALGPCSGFSAAIEDDHCRPGEGSARQVADHAVDR